MTAAKAHGRLRAARAAYQHHPDPFTLRALERAERVYIKRITTERMPRR